MKNEPFRCGWCRNGFHEKCRVERCDCAKDEHVSNEYEPPKAASSAR
jgi:hypothetical protein